MRTAASNMEQTIYRYSEAERDDAAGRLGKSAEITPFSRLAESSAIWVCPASSRSFPQGLLRRAKAGEVCLFADRPRSPRSASLHNPRAGLVSKSSDWYKQADALPIEALGGAGRRHLRRVARLSPAPARWEHQAQGRRFQHFLHSRSQ